MACWVMFFHIAAFAGMPFANQLRPAVPVDVFILISGFVIAHLVASKREPYGAFIFRRFMRLYPIYLVALVAAIGLMDIYRHIIFDSPLAPFMQSQQLRQGEVDDALLTHVLVHLTLLHGALPDAVLPGSSLALLSPAWSISLEWQFYLIAPFVIARIRGFRAFVVAFLLAYGAFWLIVASGLDFGKPSFILQRLPHFILGIGAYLFYFQPLAGGRASPRMFRIMLAVGAVCAGLLMSPAVVIGVAFLAAITWPEGMGGESFARRVEAVLSLPAAAAVGAASYSLYILHVPIIWVVLSLLLPVLGADRMTIFMVMLLRVRPRSYL